MLSACAVQHPPTDHVSRFQTETDRVRIGFEYPGMTATYVLDDTIAGNFEKDAKGAELLEDLITIESLLIKNGSLKPDYIFCEAEKNEKPTPLDDTKSKKGP